MQDMGKNSNSLVIKHNSFIESSYKMTVIQAKLLCRLAMRVNKNDEDFQKYRFSARELLKDFNMPEKAHEDLQRACFELVDKSFTEAKPKSTLRVSIFSSAEYFHEEGIIELEFSPKMKPYLLNLKENFTSYNGAYVLTLKSFYSVRIYELLKEFKNMPSQQRVITVAKLRRYLGIEDKQYKKYNDFKRYVLEQAKKELYQKCDICFTYEEQKLGRKVDSIKFNIIQNYEVLKIQEPEKYKEKVTPEKVHQEQKEINTHILNKLKEKYHITDKVAKNICLKYTDHRIESNIEYTEGQKSKGKVKDISAFVVKAIEQDYNSNTFLPIDETGEQQNNRRQSTETSGATGEIQSTQKGAILEDNEAIKRLDNIIQNLTEKKKI